MITYRSLKKYKYQLWITYSLDTGGRFPAHIEQEYFSLGQNGVMTVKRGYCWDGASGPTIDCAASMRPSLVHDVFYQMFDMGLLDPKDYRKFADDLFYKLLKEDGMWGWRAWCYHKAVRSFGGKCIKRKDSVKVYTAP